MLSAQVHDTAAMGLSMLTQVAGSQAFSGEPSPLTANPASLEQKKKPACKRKRSTDATSDTESSSSHPPTGRSRDGPKKKKANRACFHCQKAHLTCDDCECCLSVPPCSRRFVLLSRPAVRIVRKSVSVRGGRNHARVWDHRHASSTVLSTPVLSRDSAFTKIYHRADRACSPASPVYAVSRQYRSGVV